MGGRLANCMRPTATCSRHPAQNSSHQAMANGWFGFLFIPCCVEPAKRQISAMLVKGATRFTRNRARGSEAGVGAGNSVALSRADRERYARNTQTKNNKNAIH